jgi:hypothetical protein
MDFGDLGPYQNDWSPRDPSTGELITPTLGQTYAQPDQPNVPAAGNNRNQIAGWYDQYLGPGRAQAGAGDIDAWLNSGLSLGDIQNKIANSPEAQAFAQGQQKAAPAAASTQTGGFGGSVLDSPLLQPWTVPFKFQPFASTATYKPPTLADLYNDPGYQARLDAGRQAMERGAAAKGNLLTGGTVRDENQAAQDYASNEFGNLFGRNLTNFNTLYGRDLNDWTTNYNKSLGEYQQAYNIFSNNQANQFNRLAAVSGIGQTAAGQLNSAGMNNSNLFSNTTMGGANSIGDLYTQAGNAGAAGRVGAGNAWNNAFGNIANNTMQDLYKSSYAGLS